jgi:phage-related protein (TIGR01555 family)
VTRRRKQARPQPAVIVPKVDASEDRTDDWFSMQAGIGGPRDKGASVEFASRCRLTRKQLTTLYTQNAIVARLCDLIGDEALREGWGLKNVRCKDGSDYADLEGLTQRIEPLKIDDACRKASSWDRLYGAALVLFPVPDHLSPDQPLQTERANDIYPLRVVSADDARPLAMDTVMMSRTYLEILGYRVTGVASTPVDVHHTRCWPVESIELPPEDPTATTTMSRNGWSPGQVERSYDEIRRDGSAASFAVAAMFVSSIIFTKLKGGREKFKTKGGPEEIQKWLAQFNANLSALGIAAIDADDELSSLTQTTTGTPDLLDKMRDRVAATTDMPREILFNESPPGLNAGSLTGAQSLWFAKVETHRRKRIEPIIRRALEIAFAVWRLDIASFEIDWPPLWSKSDTETAQINAANATADTAYITANVFTPEEVRRHRGIANNLGPIEVEDETASPLDLDPNEAEVAGQVAAQAPPTEAGTVADTAMNGAQVQSLMTIVQNVAAGLLPRDAAAGIIGAAFPTLRGREETVLGSAGQQVAAPAADDPEAAPASTDPIPNDVVSPADAAAKFGVATRTITRQIELGRLRYWGLGAHKRVSLAEVATLARSHEPPAEAPTESDGAPEV